MEQVADPAKFTVNFYRFIVNCFMAFARIKCYNFENGGNLTNAFFEIYALKGDFGIDRTSWCSKEVSTLDNERKMQL